VRRLGFIAGVVATAAAALAVSAPADDSRTYLIEMYNAFGIVEGSDVRVAGVNAGEVKTLDVNSKKRAVVEVELSGPLAVLGENTTCSTEPQSLIAEYFIDCQPDGPEIESSGDIEDPDVPASAVEQTVQNDLVADTLREPFKRRLQLLINEFGTALAGNSENLNEAIRLGAPALRDTEKVLKVLGNQNRIIRDLNVDSDAIIARLTERREDVVRFISEARDTAAASAERRDDLSQDFAKLDDFLAGLNPTLRQLERFAKAAGPCPVEALEAGSPDCGLLPNLRASAPGLNTLVQNLPEFNDNGRAALRSLGSASDKGRMALNRGKEEIDALAKSGKNATYVGEMLADLFRDIDDPGRATEWDTRAEADTGRPTQPGCTETDPAPVECPGYTGLEGLLNYAYYQTGATNQFDQVGHLLHFNLYYIFTGDCGAFTTGRDPETGEVRLPTVGPGHTSTPQLNSYDENGNPNPNELTKCATWLGDTQPGLTQDDGLGPYDQSVCPDGTEPQHAEDTLCGPNAQKALASAEQEKKPASGGSGPGGGGLLDDLPGGDLPDDGGLPDLPDLPDLPGGGGNGGNGGGGLNLDDLLDLPRNLLNDLPRRIQDRLRNQTRTSGGGNGGSSGGGGGGNAVNNLLDFLLGP
jgi:ABC-type transporter Mla subunit MlaD